MIDMSAFKEFRAGLALLRGGDAASAMPHLRTAYDQEPDNPYYMSYLGLAVAAADQRWAEAEKLCQSAMRMNRRQAQLYLNLAEVYVAADRRQAAADVLARGLHYSPHDVRIRMALDRLAIRRRPLLSFLPRGHIINRGLGLIRHQAMQVLSSL